MTLALIIVGYCLIAVCVMVIGAKTDIFDVNDEDDDCLGPLYMFIGMVWPMALVVALVSVPMIIGNCVYMHICIKKDGGKHKEG